MLIDYINPQVIKKESFRIAKSKGIYKRHLTVEQIQEELILFYNYIWHNTEMKLDSANISVAKRGWLFRASIIKGEVNGN